MKTTQWNYRLEICGIVKSTHSLTYKPRPPAKRKDRQLQHILATLGGIAGLDMLHQQFQTLHPKYSRMRLKKLLHGARGIESIGGGYYSLTELTTVPIAAWLYSWMEQQGPQTIGSCIQAILTHYPHGSASAIRRWLQQGPEHLRLIDNLYDCWKPKMSR